MNGVRREVQNKGERVAGTAVLYWADLTTNLTMPSLEANFPSLYSSFEVTVNGNAITPHSPKRHLLAMIKREPIVRTRSRCPRQQSVGYRNEITRAMARPLIPPSSHRPPGLSQTGRHLPPLSLPRPLTWHPALCCYHRHSGEDSHRTPAPRHSRAPRVRARSPPPERQCLPCRSSRTATGAGHEPCAGRAMPSVAYSDIRIVQIAGPTRYT